jgi:hypothetical protein
MDGPAGSRIDRYRETAAALRRQTEEIRADQAAVERLLSLADGWDDLAASVEREHLRLGWWLARTRPVIRQDTSNDREHQREADREEPTKFVRGDFGHLDTMHAARNNAIAEHHGLPIPCQRLIHVEDVWASEGREF